jgi:sortase (surface protein transpeptidase)
MALLTVTNLRVGADPVVFSIDTSNRVTQSRLVQARRLDPPDPANGAGEQPASESEAPVAPVNVSTCRTDLGPPALIVTIPSLSYSCPVYTGGQATLNSGAVTSITDPSLTAVLADTPGAPGTLWLAGHRVSHGGAFAAVPSLADGALIVVSNATTTATYRVVGRIYVAVDHDQVVDAVGNATGLATAQSVLRTDLGGDGAPRLVLQTCDGPNFRWMIYADLAIG